MRVSGSPSGSKRTTNNLVARRPPLLSASSSSLLPASAFLREGGAVDPAAPTSWTLCAPPRPATPALLGSCWNPSRPLTALSPVPGLPLTPPAPSAGRYRECTWHALERDPGCCCWTWLGVRGAWGVCVVQGGKTGKMSVSARFRPCPKRRDDSCFQPGASRVVAGGNL